MNKINRRDFNTSVITAALGVGWPRIKWPKILPDLEKFLNQDSFTVTYADVVLKRGIRHIKDLYWANGIYFSRDDKMVTETGDTFDIETVSFPAFYENTVYGQRKVIEAIERDMFLEHIKPPCYIYVLRPKSHPWLIGYKVSRWKFQRIIIHGVGEKADWRTSDDDVKTIIKLDEVGI